MLFLSIIVTKVVDQFLDQQTWCPIAGARGRCDLRVAGGAWPGALAREP